uniref:Uncharacterized protein n=2 Tax=Haplochromini TaxID=319058 RepID=A0A3Q2WLI7_HAPBU
IQGGELKRCPIWPTLLPLSITLTIASGRTPSPPLSTGGDCPPAKLLTYGEKITHFGVLLFQQRYGMRVRYHMVFSKYTRKSGENLAEFR